MQLDAPELSRRRVGCHTEFTQMSGELEPPFLQVRLLDIEPGSLLAYSFEDHMNMRVGVVRVEFNLPFPAHILEVPHDGLGAARAT